MPRQKLKFETPVAQAIARIRRPRPSDVFGPAFDPPCNSLRLRLRSFPHSHPPLAVIQRSAATKDLSRFCRGSFFGLRFLLVVPFTPASGDRVFPALPQVVPLLPPALGRHPERSKGSLPPWPLQCFIPPPIDSLPALPPIPPQLPPALGRHPERSEGSLFDVPIAPAYQSKRDPSSLRSSG
jgi:hypothetical protein